MPIVINEVEVLDAPAPTSTPSASPPADPPEPAAEQLRRYLHDIDARRRRLIAD